MSAAQCQCCEMCVIQNPPRGHLAREQLKKKLKKQIKRKSRLRNSSNMEQAKHVVSYEPSGSAHDGDVKQLKIHSRTNTETLFDGHKVGECCFRHQSF